MRDNFIKFAKEVILQVLFITSQKINSLKNNGEISVAEKLEDEVITKYEKLYLGFCEKNILNNKEIDWDNIEKYIEEIMTMYCLKKENINILIDTREKLKNKSGAQVVKRLFEYEKKELNKTKYKLIDKINAVLDKEEKLSLDLNNAIQEEAQIEIIYKLQPIREEYRKLESKLIDVQNNLDNVENKLNKVWTYEIYGTVSEEDMLNKYNEFSNQ